MSEIETFEDLDVWKRSCQLSVDVHVSLYESKDFALRGQMERSSLSIPSNIAEGSEPVLFLPNADSPAVAR